MHEPELLQKLDELCSLPHETEWVEFKEAKDNYDFRKLGKYVSALSNEANLKSVPQGWLIFGVKDESRNICGSRFRENPADLDSLKHEIANETNGISFTDIHVVNHPDGRVIMFEIPPASQGIPVSFKGHFYGRDGASLVALSLQKLEQIRSQIQYDDWSTKVCDGATIEDLDPKALEIARSNFKQKNKNKDFANEIDGWSSETFLDKARLTKNTQITRACILLLGRTEASHYLEPAVPQITWKLEGEEQGYEHFAPPFLITSNELYSRIRNPNQKIDVPNQLIPYEIPKYEKWVVLEALYNAIAHQDYTRQSRIILTETVDQLTFESAGSFFEGTVEEYTLSEKTPQRYRNRFLTDAMVNLNMIDTMGYGIRRMYQEQRKRFYPLPDFDLTDPEKVIVTIYGKVIDPNYTAMLMDKKDLPLSSIILLDKVQKQKGIDKKDANSLRKNKLIEGRYPNLYVASHVASATDSKAQYIKNRAFDDVHYKELVINYLKKYGHASKKDIDGLLLDKLSDVLSDDQRGNKVRNILSSMSKKDKSIRNTGAGPLSNWVLNLDEKDDI